MIFNAEDVTADAKIYIYNTRDEVSNPITYSEIGEHIYYAEYNGKRSRVLTINVVPKAFGTTLMVRTRERLPLYSA